MEAVQASSLISAAATEGLMRRLPFRNCRIFCSIGEAGRVREMSASESNSALELDLKVSRF
jgi:hypothetical protein